MSEREYTMKDLIKGLNENRVCICTLYHVFRGFAILSLKHIKEYIQCTELNEVNKWHV